MASVTMEKMEFASGGKVLRGHLFSNGGEGPAILVTGSWTTVKEQMADLYARRLAEQGFTALTFDFRGFGESEGEPRNYESPERKIEDICAAAEWLQQQGGGASARIGGLGVCASAGYMARAIGRGAPIASLVCVAAWLHDAGTIAQAYGEDGVEQRRAAGEEAWRVYRERGEVREVPAFSATDPDAAMGEAVADYYGDPARGAVPEWSNRFAVMSWPEWLDFDGVAAAPEVAVPTLMIHSEQAAFPDNVRRFAASLKGEARVIWRHGTQTDFYDRPEEVGPAVTTAADHFRATLEK